MISILVSSRSSEQLQNFTNNVEATIGTAFEIQSVSNKNGQKGLCSVYNSLASTAKFEILLFVHEDVIFHTENWGRQILQAFESDPLIGLVGLIGSDVITKVPSGWAKQNRNYNHGSVLQTEDALSLKDYNKDNVDLVPEIRDVLAIDGVFMATKKAVWKEIGFDDYLLKGFHSYDFDYSFAVAQQHRVVIISSIVLEHFSKGNFNKEWLEAVILTNKKWQSKLPRSLPVLKQQEWTNLEYWQVVFVLDVARKFNIAYSIKLYILKQFFSFKVKRIIPALKLLKYVLANK